ncbi:MAG: phage tail protein [Oscillospiraceae bacterium]|nr:phage tail protein [Oscillospiraceae bacterium]
MESFKLEIKHLDALQKKIEGIEAASEKAVKRLVSDFKTRAPGWVSTAVTNVYGIKKADIKQSLRVRRSRDHSTFKLGGITVDNIELVYSGRNLTLTHFSMKPAAIPTRRVSTPKLIPGQNVVVEKGTGKVAAVKPIIPYQVTATIFKGKREKFEGAFLAHGKSGNILPFQRTGDARAPIEVVKRVSIPQMIKNETVEEDIYDRIDKGLQARLQHHLEQSLKKT